MLMKSRFDVVVEQILAELNGAALGSVNPMLATAMPPLSTQTTQPVRSLKSIAPKMTDQKIEAMLRQSKIQPGDIPVLKNQISAMVRGLKGNVTDQQLAGAVSSVLMSK